MLVREFSENVAQKMSVGPDGTEAQIDIATVEAVYQIVLLVIERINACTPEATDEQVYEMIKAPTRLQNVIFANIVEKYLKSLFATLGPKIIQALLDYISNLSFDDFLSLRRDADLASR